MIRERCPVCDTPLASEADLRRAQDAAPGDDYHWRGELCWAPWGQDRRCSRKPVDWRARALVAEARLAVDPSTRPTAGDRPKLPPGWRLDTGNNDTKPTRCAIGPCEGKCFAGYHSDAGAASTAAWDFVRREDCCGMGWVEWADMLLDRCDRLTVRLMKAEAELQKLGGGGR
jgi:hypothetical protein